MPVETLLLTGPGGVGKTPLDGIVRDGVARVESYRLRSGGPRGADDFFYANPDLEFHLETIHRLAGLGRRILSPGVEWFPETMTFLTGVRGDRQVIFLGGLSGRELVKAELYAPLVPVLFAEPRIRNLFGRLRIVILNPGRKVADPGAVASIRTRTEENCRLRGDDESSVRERSESVEEEARAWREMVRLGGIEYERWPFPEHLYKPGNRAEMLAAARARLLDREPGLSRFFLGEEEILAGAWSQKPG